MDEPNETRLVNLNDAAERFQISASGLSAAAREGRIPSITIGRRRFFREEVIEAILGGLDPFEVAEEIRERTREAIAVSK